jgi:hypothetical protein
MPREQNKERILMAARRKCQITYSGKPIRITVFSAETIKFRRAWTDVFQAIKINGQQRLLYPAKLKTFHDKHKLKQFMTTKLALQKIIKVILHTEEEESCIQS